MCWKQIYTYANSLDPDQPTSNSATGLKSNLFTTQYNIPIEKKQIARFLTADNILKSTFKNYPAFKGLNIVKRAHAGPNKVGLIGG